MNDAVRTITPPHDRPYYIQFNDSNITIYDYNYSDTANTTTKGLTKRDSTPIDNEGWTVTDMVILKLDHKCKSRGLFVKADNITLWNS